MTLAQILSLYGAMNAAVACAFLGILVVEKLLPKAKSSILLELHYCIAAMITGVLIVQATLPRSELIEPVAKVWSAPSMQIPEDEGGKMDSAGYVTFTSDASSHSATSVASILAAFALASLIIGMLYLIRGLKTLRQVMRSAHLIRRVRRVRIWSSDDAVVPFSYWTLRGAHIVVPASWIARPRAYRMIVAHEAQHHRQGDTRWLYFFGVLRLLCIANPFAHLWSRRISLIQELACDEAVVERHRWSIKSYGNCLLDVATKSGDQRAWIVGATAMLGERGSSTLKRRLENMLSPKVPRGTSLVLGFASIFFVIMTTASYAAGNWVRDRRVTLEQAQQLAARMDSSSGFAIVINDEVLREINRYAGTPQGRELMHASLKRFDSYRGLVSETFGRYEVPAPLMAIPIVESGYENLEQAHNKYQSAGIWQFIPRTARAYGLRVDAVADERLDPVLLTDAAARLLQAEHFSLGDWQLAALAYNMGGARVQKAIETTGSRDAWVLVRAGAEGDKGYLARLSAAALIMANPALIE